MIKDYFSTRHFLIVFSILTVILTVAVPLLPLSGEERVYDDTLRLHVIANSDSEKDQELKLKVRDSLLDNVSFMLDSCTSQADAVNIIKENSDYISKIAQDTVIENGFEYNVQLSLGKEYYPEREYEGVRLPSGTYTSLRIIIGEGDGHNWWCVLYPTLCTGAAKPEKELASAGFTPNQIRVLTENESPKYKVRFKIVVFFEKLFS